MPTSRASSTHPVSLSLTAAANDAEPHAAVAPAQAPPELAISVVVSFSDAADDVRRSLRSALRQSHAAVEILLIDDGSAPAAASIARREFADDVRVLVQGNRGIAAARNLGIHNANSRHIAFLDANDEWSRHYLRELTCLIEEFPACELWATSYQNSTHTLGYTMPDLLIHKTDPARFHMTDYFRRAAHGAPPFHSSCVCIARSLVSRVGFFAEEDNAGAEIDMWNRAALHSDIAYSRRVLVVRHVSGTEDAATIPKSECDFSRKLQQQAMALGNSSLSHDLMDYTAVHLLDLAARNLQAGDRLSALRLLADPRARRLPGRWLYWFGRCLFGGWLTPTEQVS